jgi:hypothetical protein
MMMHGFGDHSEAHVDSARLLEHLVKKFLTLLLESVRAVLPSNLPKSTKVLYFHFSFFTVFLLYVNFFFTVYNR